MDRDLFRPLYNTVNSISLQTASSVLYMLATRFVRVLFFQH